jgi:hypothetical protein
VDFVLPGFACALVFLLAVRTRSCLPCFDLCSRAALTRRSASVLSISCSPLSFSLQFFFQHEARGLDKPRQPRLSVLCFPMCVEVVCR